MRTDLLLLSEMLKPKLVSTHFKLSPAAGTKQINNHQFSSQGSTGTAQHIQLGFLEIDFSFVAATYA